MKKVICLETKEVFESSVRASEWLNCSRQAVNSHLKGKTKTCCGYHFMYYEVDNKELQKVLDLLLGGENE